MVSDKEIEELLEEHQRKENFKKTFFYDGRRKMKINEDTLFSIPNPPKGTKMFKKNKKAMEKWQEYIKNRELQSKEEEKNNG